MSQQKKLRKAYEEGVNDAHEFWETVIKHTPGIGPILEKRLINKAIQEARRRLNQ